jgi:YesN/AraC family two-component response regulator
MKKRNGIFIIWFVSYLLVLAIPLLFFIVFQFKSQRLLELEIKRSNDALLTQVQQSMDNQLNDISRLSTQLMNDPRIIYFLRNVNDTESHWKLTAADLISSFSNIKIANGAISDFYIYINGTDIGLTTSTMNQGSLLYANYHQSSGMTKDVWTALMAKRENGTFVNLGKDVQSGTQLAYLKTLPFPNIDRDAVKLVVLLNNERMLQAISNVKLTSDTRVLIMDGEQHVVMSTDPSWSESGRSLSQFDGLTGSLKSNWNGQKVTVSYLKSDETHWTYLTVVPTEVYESGMAQLRMWIGWYIVLCIGIGGAAAYWITRRNYRPIGSMVDFVSDKVKINIEESKNEFSLLQHYMKESVTRQDESDRRLSEQHQTMRGNFLIRMLRGKLDTNPVLTHALERYEFRFASDMFMMVLVQLEDIEGLFRTHVEAEQRDQFVHLIVTNIMEEMINRHHQSYSVEIDGKIAFLVNVSGQADQAKQVTLQVVKEAQMFIQSKFCIKCSIAVSDPHLNWSGIAAAYQEALEAIEYKFILGQNQTISYDMIKRPKEELYYPMDVERQLISHITIGNYEEAAEVVQHVLTTNFSGGTLSILWAKCLMFELIGTMLKAVEQIKLSSKEIELEKMDLFRSMVQCETIAEIEAEILSFLTSVCVYLQSKKKSHNTDLRDEIKSYVMENLHDNNLSLTMISVHFNINPSYLSRFFKEQFGDNLIDFISQQRIEHAKLLLRDGNMSINEVLEKAGFANNNTFTRVFRRYENMTPSQYKQMFTNS